MKVQKKKIEDLEKGMKDLQTSQRSNNESVTKVESLEKKLVLSAR